MGTPGGPLSGGLEASNTYALEDIKQHRQEQAQPRERQEPVQQTEQRQETQAMSPSEMEAAAKEKVLMENERTAQKRIAELAERFGNTPNTQGKEQQQEQER